MTGRPQPHPEQPARPRRGLRVLRALLWVAGAAVLAIAFAGYLQPSFIVDLANRIYLCF